MADSGNSLKNDPNPMYYKAIVSFVLQFHASPTQMLKWTSSYSAANVYVRVAQARAVSALNAVPAMPARLLFCLSTNLQMSRSLVLVIRLKDANQCSKSESGTCECKISCSCSQAEGCKRDFSCECKVICKCTSGTCECKFSGL